MDKTLELKSVSKWFNTDTKVLDDISFSLSQGTKISVLGPSGSGKTTLLRIIAGLEFPDEGTLSFNGECLNQVPSHKRQFGMMFQNYALFPHMTVFDNIAFGLKMKNQSKSRIEQRVSQMLALTGLLGFEKRSIDELSGGEAQRVALARTLAPNPSLLMLDEPLSSLDAALRKKLLNELSEIISHLNMTTIFVTHDHDEAFRAGNLIMLLNKGRIVQIASKADLLEHPVNDWVRDFLNV